MKKKILIILLFFITTLCFSDDYKFKLTDETSGEVYDCTFTSDVGKSSYHIIYNDVDIELSPKFANDIIYIINGRTPVTVSLGSSIGFDDVQTEIANEDNVYKIWFSFRKNKKYIKTIYSKDIDLQKMLNQIEQQINKELAE